MKRIGLLVLVLLSVASVCHAGPPFVTDDPEPVEYQHWEFYLGTIDQKNGHDLAGTAPHVELNYGLLPDLQVHMIAPLAYDVSPEHVTLFGPGDLELGAKYRFIHEDDKGWVPQVGIFPLLELPFGNSHEGLGSGHLVGFVPVWIQKSWGDWTAYGGYGYGINSLSGSENWHFVGAVLSKQVSKDLLLGVEIYHQTEAQVDFPNKGTAFNVGMVYNFSEEHHLLLSAGRSIDGPTNFQFYVAYQFTFDNSFFSFLNGRR